MSEKARLKRKIFELDFAIYELALFLDSHPDNRRALDLMCAYRKKREEAVAEYEEKCGKYFITADDTPATAPWQWIESPWPWEINFMEG